MQKIFLGIAAALSLAAEACTAGTITDQNGNAWNISTPTAVEFWGSGNSNVYVAHPFTYDLTHTVFSLDPNAPSSALNTSEEVASGDYNVELVTNNGEKVYYSAGPVNLGSYAACPYNDYFTGKQTACQLLQLEVYPSTCSERLPKPYENGSTFVIPLGDGECH